MSLEVSNWKALLAEYSDLPEFAGTGLTSVHDRGQWDSMPLHIAVHRKRSEEVKVILAAGADPNAPGEYGERPLHIAVRRKLFEIVAMLLRSGARCDLKDGDGMNVWEEAEANGVQQELQEIAQAIRTENEKR